MARYVLLYTGKGRKPAKDVAHIEAMRGVTIIDKTTPNIVIVEAGAAVKKAVSAMTDWVAGEETKIDVPHSPHF
jgi:hypothetical protein